MTGVVWSAEMERELRRGRASGESFGRIARRLGVTKNAAIGAAGRIGLLRRAPKPIPAPPVFPARGGCLWGFGHVGDAGFRFCGAPADGPGSPWCAMHRARVYVRG